MPVQKKPFGLNNTLATVQGTMEHCARDMNLCYLDDVVVFSATFEDHQACLDAVLVQLH